MIPELVLWRDHMYIQTHIDSTHKMVIGLSREVTSSQQPSDISNKYILYKNNITAYTQAHRHTDKHTHTQSPKKKKWAHFNTIQTAETLPSTAHHGEAQGQLSRMLTQVNQLIPDAHNSRTRRVLGNLPLWKRFHTVLTTCQRTLLGGTEAQTMEGQWWEGQTWLGLLRCS